MNKPIKDIKIVIGAGEYVNNPGWIHTQEEELNLLDENTWQNRFAKSSLSAILAEHVWEHLTYEEGLEGAKICWEYLKPSGYIRCAVPDGYFPDESYQEIVQVGGPGPIEYPASSHKIVHNYQTLTKMFETAGYEVKLLEYCDEQGDFRQNERNGQDGVIFRSKKYDPRNQGDELTFPSLIVDAVKSG
ncbi:Predicted SAM-depedendent methyltransferase [Gracilibacillus ureilyticus]|uniref:Predicted SAM-depedendent methyltransferase n=1 Tax=Gracilibacillus ureilyticus TaxID=531814 RepID=A0A1H9VA50_9BACI|nr:SAM-dependent methyltransferase [Gracilibacillus ureilyticus]SES18700.1 Predicted SAM-depedendent methyltransferase [Gracilibacillus ureilyticus]